MKNIRVDTPEIVEQYMNEICKKKKTVKTNKKKTKTKVIVPKKTVDKRCKKKHDKIIV